MPSPRAKQLDLGLKRMSRHGGHRPGAGRKRTSTFQSHVARPRFRATEPLHVTLRLQDELPSLRRQDLREALARAVGLARKRGLAIAHFSCSPTTCT
jgi:hypothetical protein